MVTVLRQTPSLARRVVGMALGFALLFAAVDLLLASIDMPQVYGSTNRALWKWQLWNETEPRPDVVVLGCSYEVHGINPEVIDAQVAQEAGRAVRSLNLAASASSLLTEYLLVRRLIESGEPPSVVYLGITPHAVDGWLHSWMRHGLRAMGDVSDIPLALGGGASLASEALLAGVLQSYHLWQDVRLLTQRAWLGAPLQPRSKVMDYPTGYAEWKGENVAARGLGADPENDETLPDDVTGSLRMKDDGVNGIAVRRAIAMLREAGVQVRLMELPLSSKAPAYADPARNRRYRDFVDRLVRETGVTLLRPPAGLLNDSDYWDDVHLSRRGADKVSRWLANDVGKTLAHTTSVVAAKKSGKSDG